MAFTDKQQPCTSRQALNDSHSVQETIEQVILMHQNSSDTDDRQNVGHDASNVITLNDVSGAYLKSFPFSEDHSGVKLDIYTTQFDNSFTQYF